MEIYKNLDLNNLEGEEWLPVVGYEWLYAVSNMGRVKSLRDNNGKPREKILKQGKNNKGYLQVNLCKDGKIKNCRVHRLVANAFIPNQNGYRCVNHKDENKTNNCVDNLEWCTYHYNNTYGTVIQRRVASTDYKTVGRKSAEKLSKRVYQYDKNGTLVAIYHSTQDCERNGYKQGHISECCNGKLKHYKNYIWSYTEL